MSNDNQNNKKKRLAIILLILLLLGLLTAAILASCLGFFTKKEQKNYIDIDRDNDHSVSSQAQEESVNEKGVVILDEVDIFKVSYDETGEYAVETCDGDKLIAPGSDWSYDLTLRNMRSVAMDYTLRVEAFVRGTDLTLPVLGRMKGPDNKWMTGAEGNFVPVLTFDGLKYKGVLSGGYMDSFKLDWRWPFESASGDELEAADAFDTMLGNMAVDQDLVLTIRFIVYAEEDENPDAPGGIPPTGDDFNITLWMTLMILSLFVFLAVLAKDRKRLTPAQEYLARIAAEDNDEEHDKDSE